MLTRVFVTIVLAGTMMGCKHDANDPVPVNQNTTTEQNSTPSSDTTSQQPVTHLPKISLRENVHLNNNCNGLYEYLPSDYDSSAAKRYPLLLYFHGYGELGNGRNDLNALFRNDLPKRIQDGEFPESFHVGDTSFKFIIVCPQFIKPPSAKDVGDVIQYALSHYNVDTTRLYLTGISMGGGAVWKYLSQNPANPRKIAAVVPICGYDLLTPEQAKIIADAHLPIWATHNIADPTVKSSWTITNVSLIEKIERDSSLVKFTIFKSAEHDAWSHTYDPSFREDGKNIYQWMLQFSR
jgi:predicted peptidase